MKKLEQYLSHDYAFVILLAVAAAAVVGATSMYFTNGVGMTNEIFVAELFDIGKNTGDYSGAAAFSAGFLIARVLEGPLVGVLDIGGSLMTGVGVGIPALLIASGFTSLIESFPLALLTGFGIGFGLGVIIIAIRKLAPNAAPANATAIMIGAGNKTGEALGPLVLFSAVAYSIPAGIGAIAGALLFYKFKKPIVGGAILGAMALAGFLLLLGVGTGV